ncbi:MAG TPA: transporter substrate-binding domain-containing protein [Chloroflexota bacterium]|nr:transporter substrate-binding domain-containing protein [Chloroflexota bacterium]
MKKNSPVLNIVLVILVVLFLCVGAALVWQLLRPSGATPTPVPTATLPESQSEDAWERVQANGRILVGTSADYPPFEFYNTNFQLDGFDIALMREIGQRLGLTIEFRDMAFDGLGNALELNNIDVAAAAITVTENRDQFVDFSNTYFISEDALLANATSPINSIDNASQITNQRVGVQRGTVYDRWIQTNLVATGQMPAANVLVYESIQHALRDLREGRIDLVALDLPPAQAAVAEGGVKIVGQGLNKQQLALAIGNGQTALQAQLNSALTAMINEGRITALIKQYMNFDDNNIVPLPTPPPVTPTPVPTATAQPCIDDMAFVQDLNLNDQNMTAPPQMSPGWPFVKGWRVRNSGTCPWNSSYRLVYVAGNNPAAQMGGQPTPVQGTVASGQLHDFFVNLVSPLQPGVYQGFWQMVNDRNTPFGQRIWVGIEVVAPATATPAPTQTPVQNIQFTVDRSNIQQGECVVFTWNVTGAQSVFFSQAGAVAQTASANFQGTSTQCPQSTTVYELRVVWPDGSSEVRQITITVTPQPQAPRIDRFTVDPPNQINAGECVVIRWSVTGQVDQVSIARNDAVLWPQAPLGGEVTDCPPGTGQVTYRLTANGPGGSNQAQQTINVVQPPPQPPTATPVPPAPPPVINNFSVTPAQITAGECVLVAWSVGGASVRTQIQRNGQVILDNAPAGGSQQDCLTSAGSYAYRVQTWNANNESAVADQTITVAPPAIPPGLTNTRWVLYGYWDGVSDVPPIPGTEVWIQFSDDGRFTGNGGCNDYNGAYQAQGNSLQVTGDIARTNIACAEPVGIAEQENLYFSNLTAVRQFTLTNGELQLIDGNGRIILRYTVLTVQPR